MNKKLIYLNSIVIAVLATIATLSGLFWKGLYQHDTISMAAQGMGQDLITLTIGIPLLLLSAYLISRNSLRGQLIWMGMLFYFAYTYAVASFGAAYNPLFLVYVALLSISMYTFLYGLVSLDVKHLKQTIPTGITTKAAGVFLVIMAVLVALMWVSMIVGSLLTGLAPSVLANYTTLVVQAIDLAVLLPAAIISGILLLKNNQWGYAFASILLVKISLLGSAILSMIFFMARNGVNVALGQALLFIAITVLGVTIAAAFYNQIKETTIRVKDDSEFETEGTVS